MGDFMDFSKLIEWIKLSPKYLLPISLISGLLIFSNEKSLNVFGLNEFVNKFRSLFGIIFLVSVALVISDLILHLFAFGKNLYLKLSIQKMRKAKLMNLTPDQKDLLYRYIYYNTRAQNFPVMDGNITELVYFKIIYQASIVGWLEDWAYNIQPWAWDYLQKHKAEIFSEEDIERFLNTLNK